MENNEWVKGRPITDEEINKLRKQFKNNTIQTKPDLIRAKLKPNKTWWTETKLWIVSSIFFITFLTLGWFYPMIALAICLIALGAVLLYVLVWLGTLLLKEILGLDDNE
jgi:Flp pilus assembly protein TadB